MTNFKNTLAENMPPDKIVKCATCKLESSLLQEVNDQRLKYGRSAHAISVGLSRMGIHIGEGAIAQHFRSGHAETDR